MSDRTKRTGMTVVGVLIALVGVWGAAMMLQDDPEVAELERLRDERISSMEEMSREERRAVRDDMRQRVESLDENQRKTFFERSMPIFQKMMEQRMDAFFEMPAEQQRERLDEIIDRRESGGGGGPRGGPRRGGDASPAERDQRRKEMLARTTPEMRAKMDRFKDMVNQRREDRGLDPVEGMRGMFGPPRGR
ncbi:MAG: hypothetical protein AAGA92_12920 [Planctomycetota bacterium]